MEIDKKILEELKRFNQITKYVINEQEAPVEDLPAPPAGDLPAPPAGDLPAPPAGDLPAPPAGDVPAPPAEGGDTATEVPEPVDVETDPDVEEVGDEGEGKEGEGEETEEIDITDLVTAQKDLSDKQDEIMDTLFSRLDDLQSKLENMDQIMNKINSLEIKFDKYREKTPEERLELRSLDSYPYNQKLTDFFDDKKIEMDKAGKNEYVLTSDEIENFSPNEIKKTFNKYEDEEEEM